MKLTDWLGVAMPDIVPTSELRMIWDHLKSSRAGLDGDIDQYLVNIEHLNLPD